MSDGGSSRLRGQLDTESAEPPLMSSAFPIR